MSTSAFSNTALHVLDVFLLQHTLFQLAVDSQGIAEVLSSEAAKLKQANI